MKSLLKKAIVIAAALFLIHSPQDWFDGGMARSHGQFARPSGTTAAAYFR